jgi:uncharacterized protein with PIN domain
MAEVVVRVYGPLNDFLPAPRRHVACPHLVEGHPSVKDLIEGLGIPHPEIDLILVNLTSVPFDYKVQQADRIAVFPRFATFDISEVSRVRPQPLDTIRFVADVHLGKLARRLRLLGLDTAYRRDATDAELADTARAERRILLTRDRRLLTRRIVTHGCLLRTTDPHHQVVEVLRRFGPLDVRPFSRCLRCNTQLHETPKSAVEASLPPRTRTYYDRFLTCSGCGRIYWKGSHWKRLMRAANLALEEADGRTPG